MLTAWEETDSDKGKGDGTDRGACISGWLSIECPQRTKHYEQCDVGSWPFPSSGSLHFSYPLPSVYLFCLTNSTLTFSLLSSLLMLF